MLHRAFDVPDDAGIEDVRQRGQPLEAQALLEAVERTDADIAIIDARLDGDGISALSQLKSRRPELSVLIFSTYENPSYITGAAMQGAAGYVMKSASSLDLVRAIEAVRQGSDAWNQGVSRRRIGTMAALGNEVDIEISLTRREAEVLHKLAEGMSNQQIGDSLDIGYETVKEHMKQVLRKIGVSDRTQAAVWAVRNGLV